MFSNYEDRSESKECFAIQRYLLIIGKKQNIQVLSHTPSPTSPHSHLGHWGSCRTVTPVYLFPPRTRRPPGYFAVWQMFGHNFVHNCTRHFRTLFVHFAHCEMSILSNDAVHLLPQCVCDDRGSPWCLSVMNICSPIPKYCAPFSDTGHVHNMFAIDCNKSSVNFTVSNVFHLQKPNHASHLTVGGIWYRRVHCHNPLHSQHEKFRCINCTR